MPDSIEKTKSKADVFESVSVGVRVCVGTARPTLQELVSLEAETVLPLDRAISDEVELFVGERLVATGTLEEDQENPGKLCVRIVSVGTDK